MFWQIEDLIHEVLHFTPAQVQQQIIDIMVCQCISTVEQLRRVTADDLRQLRVPCLRCIPYRIRIVTLDVFRENYVQRTLSGRVRTNVRVCRPPADGPGGGHLPDGPGGRHLPDGQSCCKAHNHPTAKQLGTSIFIH
jgi:hypothetical protein